MKRPSQVKISCRSSSSFAIALRTMAARTMSSPIPETSARTTNAGACRALYHPGRPTWSPNTRPSVE